MIKKGVNFIGLKCPYTANCSADSCFTFCFLFIRRNRDENAASPFICRVVELEQEKLEVQRKNAGLIVGKDGRVYEP